MTSPISSFTVIRKESIIFFPPAIFRNGLFFDEYSTLSKGLPLMSKHAKTFEGFSLKKFSFLSTRSQLIKRLLKETKRLMAVSPVFQFVP